MKKICILTAEMGLGTYTASVNLKNAILERNNEIVCDIMMYETLMPEEKRNRLPQYRLAFHNDKRLAEAGHILMKKFNNNQDSNAIAVLFTKWDEACYDQFIIMSGNWIPIIETYGIHRSKVICVRLDCSPTATWIKYDYSEDIFDTIWLLGKDNTEPNFVLYKESCSLSVYDRLKQVFVHGGGWGMGNYLETLGSLTKKIKTKTLVHQPSDCTFQDENNEYLLLDSNWKAGTEDTFPVLYEFDGENITNITKINGIDIMKNSVAVVSKPGGGTIIDSLATQTPMIYLDPISKHEKNNMDFYLTRNLGLSLNNALSANELVEQLKRIQDNILNYTSTKSLLVDYIL